MEKIYTLIHTVASYEGEEVFTSTYHTLEEAKNALRDDYEFVKSDYDELHEDECYIADDGMSAYIEGEPTSTYGRMANATDYDKFEIKESTLK